MKLKIGLYSAISLVISAMVGTGVYTSLGFQVIGTPSVWAILMLWLTGGLIALCGSLTYGEVGTLLSGSGGEYNYLSKIYHPVVGFMSGFVSSTIGFAAPVALSSMAFGNYMSLFFPEIPSRWLASMLLLVVMGVQLGGVKSGALFQRLSTVLNIVLIGVFILLGILAGPHAAFQASFGWEAVQQILSPAFAVSLVYVSYSYSGWNSSAYMAAEIEEPAKNLPLSLLYGTSVVVVLYLALNFTFLLAVPQSELAGNVEVGQLAAIALFGQKGGYIVSALIGLGLLASVNAMCMVGPRVTQTIAQDFPAFRMLAAKTKNGNPLAAQFLLVAIAFALIHTSTFKEILIYTGFILSVFTCLVVAGIFVLRRRFPNAPGFKTWGYPFTPLFFIVADLYMMFFIFKENPLQSLAGVVTAGMGAVLYFISSKRGETKIPVL